MAQLLHSDKINLIKFYEEMEGRAKNRPNSSRKAIELNLFEEQLKKNYGGKISEREIVAAFHAIDLESVGYLEKSNFLYCITSHINKILSGDDNSRRTQQEWNSKSHYQQDSPLEASKTTPKRPERPERTDNEQSKMLPYTPTDSALERLQNEHKLTLYAIYE